MMGYLLIHLCFTSFLYGLYSSEKGWENQKMEEIVPLLLLGPFMFVSIVICSISNYFNLTRK